MMNRIKASSEDGKVELECSIALEEKFREFFEIEFLQGIRTIPSPGMVRIVFQTTPEKVEVLRKVLLQVISKSDDINFN